MNTAFDAWSPETRGESRMSERARLRRHSERSVPDEVAAILAEGRIAHLGFEIDGQPYVIPMLYHFDPEPPTLDGLESRPARLFLHGSTRSRSMMHLATGAPVCVTVTHLDQLVFSKTAFDHSANYRSAVCFGTARVVTDAAEKNAVLERMVGRYFDGRIAGSDYQRALPGHLEVTMLVAVDIEEASGKIRSGPPNGPDDDDPEALGTAGLVDV